VVKSMPVRLGLVFAGIIVTGLSTALLGARYPDAVRPIAATGILAGGFLLGRVTPRLTSNYAILMIIGVAAFLFVLFMEHSYH
jgi:hypothetical protein